MRSRKDEKESSEEKDNRGVQRIRLLFTRLRKYDATAADPLLHQALLFVYSKFSNIERVACFKLYRLQHGASTSSNTPAKCEVDRIERFSRYVKDTPTYPQTEIPYFMVRYHRFLYLRMNIF